VSDFIKACCQVIGGAFQLSSFHARTLLGFILMVDDFRPDNGMTRFVPGSHRWRLTPATSNWPRRSLQGAFIPQQGRAATDFAARMQPDTRARLSSLARSVLALPAV
jgi:ectoine hydroxylase-related dioxygenase (phytanoyl-CoA dioxygenase family)